MRKFLLTISLFVFIISLVVFSCTEKTVAPEKAIAQTLNNQVDSFSFYCNALDSAVSAGKFKQQQLQSLFLQFRAAYKKFEWAAEYFVPATSRVVNGPPVQEVEVSGQIIEPAGLQVIEGFLFPNYDSSHKKDVLRYIRLIPTNCETYKSYFTNIGLFNSKIFDAAKLEVFRIMTLGIAGFDNPLSLKSMQESAISFKSLQNVFAFYPDTAGKENVPAEMDLAIKYLLSNTDFNSFDRMEFLTNYCNPITVAISNLEKDLKIHVYKYNRLLNQDAKTLFDTNAFNLNAYTPDFSSNISDEKIVLGKELFFDPVLSGNGKRSCASCHMPGLAFTDGLVKNTVLGGKNLLERNTPTLINAALQPALFYDLRVNSLEDQSHTVVQNAREMHGSMIATATHLWMDSNYRRQFLHAYPNGVKNSIDTFAVMNVLGSYIRSLTKLNSRFDDYMRGNKTALNDDEIRGFNLFMGKAKCATCHYMPIFNGTFPPRYIKIESETIGVPETNKNEKIDPDLGVYNIVPVEFLKHSFKVPTIRNIALTAPYMHNGVFTTLEQVMNFYNKGGGAGLGFSIPNQTLPIDKLNLSDKEVSDVIAFMKSLDSKI
jgi:cytochrome c peroxidase